MGRRSIVDTASAYSAKGRRFESPPFLFFVSFRRWHACILLVPGRDEIGRDAATSGPRRQDGEMRRSEGSEGNSKVEWIQERMDQFDLAKLIEW